MSHAQQHLNSIAIYSQSLEFLQRFRGVLRHVTHPNTKTFEYATLAPSQSKLWIIDLNLPEVIATLVQILQQTKDNLVFVVGSLTQTEPVIRAIHAGASGCMLCERDDAEIILALRSLIAGDAPIDPAITRQLLASLLQQLPQQNNITALVESEIELTNRERQILQLVAEGLSNQQIAAQLYVSRHTVDSHVKHIYRKLEVTKRMQAVSTARHLGLL